MGRSGQRRMITIIDAISTVIPTASRSPARSGLPAEPPIMTMTPARHSPAETSVARPGASRIHTQATAAAAKGAVAWTMATLATAVCLNAAMKQTVAALPAVAADHPAQPRRFQSVSPAGPRRHARYADMKPAPEQHGPLS